jgi:hypothetical protein
MRMSAQANTSEIALLREEITHLRQQIRALTTTLAPMMHRRGTAAAQPHTRELAAALGSSFSQSVFETCDVLETAMEGTPLQQALPLCGIATAAQLGTWLRDRAERPAAGWIIRRHKRSKTGRLWSIESAAQGDEGDGDTT